MCEKITVIDRQHREKGPDRGILVMHDQLILFSVKLEFRKLFLVTRELKILRDP